MDGFFVAKIQKLSDRRPEDKNQGDAIEDGIHKDIDQEHKDIDQEELDVDWMDEVKKMASNKTKDKALESDTTKTSDKKNGVVTEFSTEEHHENKRRKLSVPPKHPKKQKKSQNASVTKPRRRKLDSNANM